MRLFSVYGALTAYVTRRTSFSDIHMIYSTLRYPGAAIRNHEKRPLTIDRCPWQPISTPEKMPMFSHPEMSLRQKEVGDSSLAEMICTLRHPDGDEGCAKRSLLGVNGSITKPFECTSSWI